MADWYARDNELRTPTEICLHEYADRKTAKSFLVIFHIDFARGGTASAFELVTDHACPTADAPFFDRAAKRGIESVKDVLRLYMKAVYIIEPAVPSLGHNRQTPRKSLCISASVRIPPRDYGIARHADAVRVCYHDRSFEKSAFFDPGRAGHLAISIE